MKRKNTMNTNWWMLKTRRSIESYRQSFRDFWAFEISCSHTTDGKLITKAVLQDTGVPANFWKLKSNRNSADNKITKNFQVDLIHPHIKTTAFSLYRSKMNAHKLLFWKNKNRSLRTAIKKTFKNSLGRYKKSYFASYTQKQLFLE